MNATGCPLMGMYSARKLGVPSGACSSHAGAAAESAEVGPWEARRYSPKETASAASAAAAGRTGGAYSWDHGCCHHPV